MTKEEIKFCLFADEIIICVIIHRESNEKVVNLWFQQDHRYKMNIKKIAFVHTINEKLETKIKLYHF